MPFIAGAHQKYDQSNSPKPHKIPYCFYEIKKIAYNTMKDQITYSIAGIIFSKDRKNVLLIKRRDVPVWVLPGGGKEEGESYEEAIIREIKEETGFSVKITKTIGEYFPMNRLSRHTYLYECEILDGRATISNETKEVKFFPLDSLPKLMPPPYDEWIEDAAKNLPQIIKKKMTRVNYPTLIKNLILHPQLVIRFLLSRMGIYINSK